MKPNDTFFSREHRYSLGMDEHSGFYYLSFPVTSGVADYEEYYKLSDDEHERYLADPIAALAFVEECRRQEEHDIRLLQKPGWNRGVPSR